MGIPGGSGSQQGLPNAMMNSQGQGMDLMSMKLENRLADKTVEVMMGMEREREKNGEGAGVGDGTSVMDGGKRSASASGSGSTPGSAGPTTPPVINGGEIGETGRDVESDSKKKVDGRSKVPGYAMEFDKESPIYPYNAAAYYPTVYLQRPGPRLPFESSKFQRMIVPSLMPKGMDPYLLLEERNRHIDEKMALREKELMSMASNIGMGDSGAEEINGLTDNKPEDQEIGYNTLNGQPFTYQGSNISRAQMRAIIELRALRLRDKQKIMREEAVRDMNAASQLPSDRMEFRRFRAYAPRDARTIEDLEKKQRIEREEQSKKKHVDYILGICEHGRHLKEASARASAKAKKMGEAVLSAHRYQEREEQKRIEKLSKERLKALKNDDEDGYRALIDQAKDTRITHLLKRTDMYLDSLVAQINVQKRDVEAGGMPRVGAGPKITKSADLLAAEGEAAVPGEEEEERIDYIEATHAIKETVEKQADILVGGTLKSYQIQGLEWMISLYNNKLNGILADEMVSQSLIGIV